MNEVSKARPMTAESYPLLPGEQLVRFDAVSSRRMEQVPSSLREIYRLTDATSEDEVGNRGPAVAALPLDLPSTPGSQNLFNAVFGRDSLRVAIDLVQYYPKLARTTLLTLARSQGTQYDVSREEEPGRIVHEDRGPHDPIAQALTRERGWHWPYYGSVDATPEFIRTLYAYYALQPGNTAILFETYTDKNGEPKQLHQALDAAVEWMITRMDANAEGLIEYKTTLPKGIENQVWKDSWDAYHHADGTIANHAQPIASIEVQTVTHEALLDAADLYERKLGRLDFAKQLRDRAGRLAKTIDRLFWIDEKGGYYALGTDRDEHGSIRPLKIRTSNMGHVLNSRLIEGDHPEQIRRREAVLGHLMSSEMLAISGLRTLASDEYRYREGAYHNGSVWIWDTHHIAKGIRRHAADKQFADFADELDRRILNVINTVGGFPEYVRGGDDIAVNTHIIDVQDTNYNYLNRVEQPPQEVQAWTVAAILATKRRRARRGIL